MPRRPATTLFLITRQRVYRADFSSGTRSPEVSSLDRGDAHDLPSILELALVSGPLPGRKVYVLATDIWIQSIGIPSGRVNGLSLTEIAQALNFEAEELSGLSAQEATCVVTSLPSTGADKRYLLLQIRTTDRDRAAQLLQGRGARLAGLLHPGGLPRGDDGGEFRPRVELWPDAAVGVRKRDNEFDVVVSNADPMTGRWRSDLQEWAEPVLLVGPGVPAPTNTDPVLLDKLETLSDWFSKWAAELTQRRTRLPIPVARPLLPPTPLAVRAGLSIVLAAIVGAGLYKHWADYSQSLDNLGARIAAANKETKKLTDLEAQTKSQEKERDKLKEEAAKFEKLSQQVKNQGERYAQLLELCAKFKPDGVMIQKIECDKSEPKIVGLARLADLPDKFARDLTAAVRTLGWELQLVKKTAQIITAEGAPWAFEIHLHPMGDPTPPPPTKGKQR